LSIIGGPFWTQNNWKGALQLQNGAALAWHANSNGVRFGIGHSDEGFYFFRTRSDPAKTDAPAQYDMTIKDDGTVSMRAIEITGADLVENFEVRSLTPREDSIRHAEGRRGLVVSIDPEEPGKLVVSDHPYDRRVAGVISGAGGLEPGVLLGNRMTAEGMGFPVALTGRVYCWADASLESIAPGDLLTTSATPGHAMKVTDHGRAQGAILGKAMSRLETGVGLVLVLVTLQ
jgi:hypothetical protein